MANNNLLERSDAANSLRLSINRTGTLARKLAQKDVKGILVKRQGQRQGYRFTPETKAERIQHFGIEAVAQRSLFTAFSGSGPI